MRLRFATALLAAGLAAAPSCREASRPDATAASAPVADAAAAPDVAAAPPAREASGTLRLAYDAAQDRLDLVAHDVPLARILADLVAKTGVALEDRSGRAHAELLSPRLEGVPLAAGAEQLLQGYAKAFEFGPARGPGASPRLARILLQPLDADRVAALLAAVRRGNDDAAAALAAALAAPERRSERARAVVELADALAVEPLELRTCAVRALLALDRPAAARELAQRLRDAQGKLARDPAARARVVWALGFVGDESSEAALVEAFLGEDRAVRAAAATSLNRLRAERKAAARAGSTG